MPKRPFGIVMLAVSLVSSCDSKPDNEVQPTTVISDRSRDAGAEPTNLLSFELLSKDPATRRDLFQKTLGTEGKRCQLVTEAVLKGGFDGTDLWRIACSDTGDWLITFSRDLSVSAVSCRALPSECLAAWKSVSLDP